MNCPKCGAFLPAGAPACPACGTPVSAAPGVGGYAQGFDPTAFQTGGYQPVNPARAGGPNGRSAGDAYGGSGYGFDPTAGARSYNGYPQGYQQVYGHYTARGRQDSEFLSAVSDLPRVIADVVRDPGEALRGMMERNDRVTGGLVAGLTLVLTFLTAIFIVRGAATSVITGVSALFGSSLAQDATGVSQGVDYIAGKMAASVGGIAALCQLIAMVFPAAVALIYLCAIKKVRFSFLLASNFVAIITLPSVAASLLCMLAGLLSPYAGLVMLLVGEIASYVLLSALITWVTGTPEQRLVPTKIVMIGSAEVLKILFVWLVGGALAGAALNTVYGLIGSMGSLL